MKNFYCLKLLLVLLLFFIIKGWLIASDSLWTVTALDNPAPGYLRFDWFYPAKLFLVDNYGLRQFPDTINQITTPYYKLLRNGLWITVGGVWSDTVNQSYLFNQDMQLVDSIPCPAAYLNDTHAVDVLSNGHYLLLCQETIIDDLSKIGGWKNARIMSHVLIETDRKGIIYWKWRAYDHLNISDATSDIDLTQQVIDFTHANSFAEAQDGNILISIRNLDEITKIKKDSAGEIIWRMGGSMCKNNQFSFINDTNNDDNGFFGFSHQHSISLLPNGNILMFDNGNMRKHQYSRTVEYQIDELNKTATKVWEYRYSPDIFQLIEGSATRLSNGNTLINWVSSKITEIKPDKSMAFEITFKNGSNIFRADRYVTKMNAVSKIINGTGDYDFNDSNYTTGVTISVDSLFGSGLTTIEKHNYAPPSGDYNDTNFYYIFPFRWVFSQYGISSISGTIKLKTNTLKHLVNPGQCVLYKRDKETVGTFQKLKTVYDSANGEITANFSDFGEFALALQNITSVRNINEIDNQKIYFYPNPASDKIRFYDKKYSGSMYRIINLDGVSLLDGIVENDMLDIANLCPGNYFVIIGNDVIKFIKN